MAHFRSHEHVTTKPATKLRCTWCDQRTTPGNCLFVKASRQIRRITCLFASTSTRLPITAFSRKRATRPRRFCSYQRATGDNRLLAKASHQAAANFLARTHDTRPGFLAKASHLYPVTSHRAHHRSWYMYASSLSMLPWSIELD